MYYIITFLGLKPYFVNIVASYKGYIYRDAALYISLSRKKPLAAGEVKPSEERNFDKGARKPSRTYIGVLLMMLKTKSLQLVCYNRPSDMEELVV